MLFSPFEISWDFLMRLHALGPSVMRFPYDFNAFFWIIFWWDFMLFCRYEISLWDFMLFVAYLFLLDVTWTHALVVRGFGRGFRLVTRRWCKGMHASEFGSREGDGICWKGASGSCSWPLWDFLMRFHTILALMRSLYDVLFFWLQNLRLGLGRLEVSLWEFPYEISCFLAVMRRPCVILCFLLHNQRTRYPDEISCFLCRYELCVWDFMLVWPFWDFLMRFHAFWLPKFLFDGVMWGRWLPKFLFDGVMWGRWRGGCWRMREIEWTRWRCVVVCVCKLGGSLAGEMNVGWVVVWLVKVRVRWETEGFVWKLSDSCHQHALHQVDTYVWGWRSVTWTCCCDIRRFTLGLME